MDLDKRQKNDSPGP